MKDINKVIEDNTGLIYKISKYFYGVNKEDLYQAGALGLLKAYKNYNELEKAKFSSYAYDYIYGEMYNLASSKLLKINKDTLKLYKEIEKVRSSLSQKLLYIPSNEEIAKFLDLPESVIEDAILSGVEVMSLDNDDIGLYNEIKINEKISIDDKILINDSIDSLTKDERKIIKARYFNDMTQSEVAKKLRMTQVMVSRYEKKGLNKMLSYMQR